MPILVQEQKSFNLQALITFVVVILIVIGGIYFLFFAPVPGIEIIVPASINSTSELSNIEFSPENVISSEKFRALRRYTGQTTVGQIGRDNPFVKY